MATHVTRCPHCQTSFRVRDEHLTIAKGNVRCGSCLQVFNALNHLVNPVAGATNTAAPTHKPTPAEPASAAKPASPKPTAKAPTSSTATSTPADTSTPPPATAIPAEVHDDFDSVNLESQQEVSSDELFDNLFGSADDDNLDDNNSGFLDKAIFDSLNGDDTSPPEAEDSQLDDDDLLIHDEMDSIGEPHDGDESISDDPFADLGLRAPEHLDRPAPGSGLEIDDSLINLDSMDNHPLSYDVSKPENIEEEEDDDEAWARALLDDDSPPEEITRELGLVTTRSEEAQFKRPAATVAIPENTEADDEPPSANKTPIRFALADEQPEDQSNTDYRADNGLPPGFGQPPRHQQLTGNIQATPLQLDAEKQKRAKTGWLVATVALLVLLAGQVLYFNFDQWARTPSWRPVYQSLCSVFGCRLPHVQDVRSMSTRNLVVRSHPAIANALVVDTLILNNSEFDQPFPDLALIFRDLNENVIASRQFTPAEYLAGEVAGQSSMPSKTPVHVALEILDPGQNAVSYAVQLVDNQ
jgi:predicted Zn finger-like uncharacterized protein